MKDFFAFKEEVATNFVGDGKGAVDIPDDAKLGKKVAKRRAQLEEEEDSNSDD